MSARPHLRARLTPLGETVEAAIIVSVLLSFVEQLMTTGRLDSSTASPHHAESSTLIDGPLAQSTLQEKDEQAQLRIKALLKRMRIQIWAGTIAGFIVALSIGGAFIAVVRVSKFHERMLIGAVLYQAYRFVG